MRAKQPKRVIILTAVQTVTDDTMHVSSYEALMRYSSILSKQALSALSAAPVMISFEVSPWTANDRDDETDETMGMAYGGYSCSNDQTFCKTEFYMKNETERASDMVSTHLQRVQHSAVQEPEPARTCRTCNTLLPRSRGQLGPAARAARCSPGAGASTQQQCVRPCGRRIDMRAGNGFANLCVNRFSLIMLLRRSPQASTGSSAPNAMVSEWIIR